MLFFFIVQRKHPQQNELNGRLWFFMLHVILIERWQWWVSHTTIYTTTLWWKRVKSVRKKNVVIIFGSSLPVFTWHFLFSISTTKQTRRKIHSDLPDERKIWAYHEKDEFMHLNIFLFFFFRLLHWKWFDFKFYCTIREKTFY